MLKKLASQTAVYGLTTILGRFLNYLLTPLHTSVFLASEYGIITELYAYIAVLNIVFTYGMETAYFRFATKHTQDSIKAYNNAISAVFISSVILSGSIFLCSDYLAQLLNYGEKGYIIRWIAAILAIDALVAIPFARIRLLKKVYLFAGAKISGILFNIIFNIFFLFVCPLVMSGDRFIFLYDFVKRFYHEDKAVGYVFAANLLANLAYIPFFIPAIRGFKLQLDFSYLKQMLNYAWPILIMGLVSTVNDMFSRIMLKNWLPENFYEGQSAETALGIFGACYKMSVFMVLATQAFRFASEPFFFSQANDINAPKMYAKVMHYFVWVCAVIFLGVSVNVSWLSDLLIRSNEYKQGLSIVPMLLMANVFMGIYFNLSIWYKLTDRTYWGTYIALMGVAVTIAGNYFLIPIMGYHGSVWATFSSYLAMATVSYLIGAKYYPVPYNFISLLALLGGSSVLLWIWTNFLPNQSLTAILWGNLITVIFAVGGFFYLRKFT